MNDPHRKLRDALARRIGDGVSVEVGESRSRPWASATFVGARHRFVLRIEGAERVTAAARFTEGLDVMEFDVRGHIVADLVVVEQRNEAGWAEVVVEALTVEDA